MPTTTFAKSSIPLNTSSLSMNSKNNMMAIQSGPYTKAQFQSTIEGSRTIKSSEEIEQLLHDYPAALDLYRTGKYKVKFKCEAEVERVILVEKRTIKNGSNDPSTITTMTNVATPNDNQENNQNVSDLSVNIEQNKQAGDSRRSLHHTQSPNRTLPMGSAANDNNIIHAEIPFLRVTSNTQPKVNHHRTPSKELDAYATPWPRPPIRHGSHSRDSPHKTSYNTQQGNKTNQEYPKEIMPFVPYASTPGNPWQQSRIQQSYFSNPLLQQQQRARLCMPAPFMSQQNPSYRQPYYYGSRPTISTMYQQKQSSHLMPSSGTMSKLHLHSTNSYSSSPRAISNNMGLPLLFPTFHSNQQQNSSVHPLYQSQIPFPTNYSWVNMANEPIGTMTSNNNGLHVQQPQDARNRARSVDTGPRNNLSVRPLNVHQQNALSVIEHYHHHHRHRSHPTNNVKSSTENEKPQITSSPKERTNLVNTEKLTVRQLNEAFTQEHSSNRLPYSSLPIILQRFGIILSENDLILAAKDLGYNLNAPISARRLVHVLVKLGKIMKSTQHQRRPASPSMLSEDREVTDIMNRHNTKTTDMYSSNKTN